MLRIYSSLIAAIIIRTRFSSNFESFNRRLSLHNGTNLGFCVVTVFKRTLFCCCCRLMLHSTQRIEEAVTVEGKLVLSPKQLRNCVLCEAINHVSLSIVATPFSSFSFHLRCNAVGNGSGCLTSKRGWKRLNVDLLNKWKVLINYGTNVNHLWILH